MCVALSTEADEEGSSILGGLESGTWAMLGSSTQFPPPGGALQGSPSDRCRDRGLGLTFQTRPETPPTTTTTEGAMPLSEARNLIHSTGRGARDGRGEGRRAACQGTSPVRGWGPHGLLGKSRNCGFLPYSQAVGAWNVSGRSTRTDI